MKGAKKSVIMLLFAGSLFLAEGLEAWGCASCGSGGDDPMILYPNEANKVFFGTTSISGYRNIGPSGEEVTAGGPSRKWTQTLAYGRGFSPRSFATITWPLVTNLRREDSHTASGDPTFSSRYAFILQSIADPWIPQVQGIFGFKPAFARSLRNTEEPKTLIDVAGTGFPEVRVGLDLWYGMSQSLLGTAHILSYSLPRSYEGTLFQPGLTQRSTVTLGYRWAPHIKTLVGTNREYHAPIRIEGASSPSSEQLNFSSFLTQDVMLDPMTMVRLSLAQQGAYGPIQNTAKSSSVMIAYMRAF